MKTPTQRIRSVLDQMSKQAALRPQMPTGKDGRTQEEAMGTGAAARAMAAMRTKKHKVGQKPQSLACLVKRK